MAVTGRKPREGPVRHRVKPTHEWVEVDGVAFEDGPELPKRRGAWPGATVRWWDAIRRMPHCVLWDESDWQFAMDTALVAAAFHKGQISAATELRQREKVMGTTVDARRDLRIRYVDPKPTELPVSVKAIDDYRKQVEE